MKEFLEFLGKNFGHPVSIFFIFLIFTDIAMMLTAGSATAGLVLAIGLIPLTLLWVKAVRTWMM